MHFCRKKFVECLVGINKSYTFASAFRKKAVFKEAFFERFTINNKVVQAYIIYKYKETVNNLKRLKIDSGS